MPDDSVILLSDILPTAWHANELGEVGPGDRVAIWGAGPGARCQQLLLLLLLLLHAARGTRHAARCLLPGMCC
jgi:threonine dehydrogenase-like Zn-dependent dehydrogenase